jgi:peptidoglycan/xylan/chitin deacetylase (PgdA/CDA1 family)
MITLKKMDFYNTLFIMIIVSSILSLAYTTVLFLPIMARTHSSHSLHHEQQKQSPILQTSPSVISNNQGTISNVPVNPNKVVIITFGDGYQSQYTYGKPVLDKYGYKGNFFVTCNRVGTPTKMTWPELVQLYKEGNVIGSKTVDYGTKAMANRDLNHLSPQELEFEVSQSKQCLANHGINTTFFAVPKNLADNNATVINAISKYYTLAINGHSNLMYLHCNGGEQNSIQTDC